MLELIAAFERASGRKVPYRIAPRRPGDVARCYANPRKAQEMLGWKAERTLEQLIHVISTMSKLVLAVSHVSPGE